MKKVISILFIMLCFGAVKKIFWAATSDDTYIEEYGESTPEQDAAEVDRWVQEDLDSGNNAKAKNWLKQNGNMLFEGDPDEIQKLIDGLYRDGAEEVWFTGIEKFGGANVSASIAVKLPMNSISREAILKREAEFWGEETPSPDVGQKYISFYFD